MARTKSGMGTDIDLVRILLLVAVIGASIKAYESDSIPFLVGAVVASLALGWWVTRCWYLDQIEALPTSASQGAVHEG